MFLKKAGIKEEESDFVPKIKIQVPKKKNIILKRTIPTKRKEFIKHDMQIKPIKKKNYAPELHLSRMNIHLPQMSLPQKPLEKKWFVSKIKDLFKKK